MKISRFGRSGARLVTAGLVCACTDATPPANMITAKTKRTVPDADMSSPDLSFLSVHSWLGRTTRATNIDRTDSAHRAHRTHLVASDRSDPPAVLVCFFVLLFFVVVVFWFVVLL